LALREPTEKGTVKKKSVISSLRFPPKSSSDLAEQKAKGYTLKVREAGRLKVFCLKKGRPRHRKRGRDEGHFNWPCTQKWPTHLSPHSGGGRRRGAG